MSDTPRSTHKSISSTSSMPHKSSSNELHNANSRNQRELQDLMKDELYHAVFECDCKNFVAHLCPIGDSDVESAVSSLKAQGIAHNKLRYLDDKSRLRPWPSKTSESVHHSKPFASLLNIVLSCIPKRARTIHEALRFYAYGRTMVEGVDMSPIKPDIIGWHNDNWNGEDHLSWHDVQIAVEVKKHLSKMVRQAASYARSQFVFQHYRRFVVVIYFNHVDKAVRVGFHGRSGLILTKSMRLDDEAEFHNFVMVMVGIGSWTCPGVAGIDISHAGTMVAIPKMGVWEIVETLYDHKVILGRATRVYQLKYVGTQADKDTMSSITPVSPVPKHTYNLQSQRKPPSAPTTQGGKSAAVNNLTHTLGTMATEVNKGGASSLKQQQGKNSTQSSQGVDSKSEDEEPKEEVLLDWDCCSIHLSKTYKIYFKQDEGKEGPWTMLFMKDSWPLKSRSAEGKIFEPLSQEFGVPEVIKSYSVAEVNDCQEDVIPEAATACTLVDGKSVSFMHKERIHMRIILATRGRALTEAAGPHSLVQGILHAMLGHFVLFKNGWLHRDVSIGNVMLMEEEVRKPVKDFNLTADITKCFGFICDGDRAIRWENPDCELGDRPSGTLPFMSNALIGALVLRKPFSHTAVDDLESFVWVLLWSVLDILLSRKALDNKREQYYLQTMRSDDTAMLMSSPIFLEMIEESSLTGSASKGFKPFIELLIEWLKLSKLAAKTMVIKNAINAKAIEGSCITDTIESYKRFYLAYISIGLKHVKKLPETWDYIFTEDIKEPGPELRSLMPLAATEILDIIGYPVPRVT